MKLYFGGFKYTKSTNLGDQIQSIATERLLPKIDKRFDRDELAQIKSNKKYILIMNGWFSHTPHDCFPPSKQILPIFWGFHITNWNNSWRHFLLPNSLTFLKSHEPIGCRDKYTAEKLAEAGVDSFYSQCLTLTIPKRKRVIDQGWNIIVDVPIILPPEIEGNSIRLSHNYRFKTSEDEKISQAGKLLKLYSQTANLIITTRLHCALPCIAMGIPVIFFGNPLDYRVSILKDLGLKINKLPKDIFDSNKYSINNIIKDIWMKVDWNPNALDFEQNKNKIKSDFKKFLQKKISQLG